ncbi:MAG: YigZ family protein [Lachnospiraceae bacterium]|nr:YigZ family protein [Lachnospiraceae bacterium]
MEPYLLLMYPAEGEYESKRSRFLARAVPVRSEEEAAAVLSARRKEHYAARHHCYAYVLGPKNETVRFSDDGEPSGTAGKPILETLLGSGLHNALVVVTRYFGGTLLGTGGLVRAYAAAAKAALDAAEGGLLYSGTRWHVLCSYSDLPRVDRLIASLSLPLGEEEFGTDAGKELYLTEEQEEPFLRGLADATAGQALAEKGERLSFLVNEGRAIPWNDSP